MNGALDFCFDDSVDEACFSSLTELTAIISLVVHTVSTATIAHGRLASVVDFCWEMASCLQCFAAACS